MHLDELPFGYNSDYLGDLVTNDSSTTSLPDIKVTISPRATPPVCLDFPSEVESRKNDEDDSQKGKKRKIGESLDQASDNEESPLDNNISKVRRRSRSSRKSKKRDNTSHTQKTLIKKGQRLRQVLKNHTEAQETSYNSSLEISNASSFINEKLILIHDIESAKSRILQWYNHSNHCNLIQGKPYKLQHLRMLYDIYEELINLGHKLKKKGIKSWILTIVIETLKVDERTERRH